METPAKKDVPSILEGNQKHLPISSAENAKVEARIKTYFCSSAKFYFCMLANFRGLEGFPQKSHYICFPL